MNSRVLVDTSCFVDYFRGSDKSAIPSLAFADAIILSRVVRLELLKGTGRGDRRILLSFLDGLIQLEEFPPANQVEKLLTELHGKGFGLGVADLLILSDARFNKCHLMTADKALTQAASAVKVPLVNY